MANRKAASEELMGKIHAKVAAIMLKALDQIDSSQEAYDEALSNAKQDAVDEVLSTRPEVSPAFLSAVTKFLSDNKITCNPMEDENVSELEQRLAAKRKRRAVGNVVHFVPEED